KVVIKSVPDKWRRQVKRLKSTSALLLVNGCQTVFHRMLFLSTGTKLIEDNGKDDHKDQRGNIKHEVRHWLSDGTTIFHALLRALDKSSSPFCSRKARSMGRFL